MSSPANGTLNGNVDAEKRDPSEIKPVIPQSFIKDIVHRLYGMEVIDFIELNSYDDRNYHIHVDKSINNTYIDDIHPPGYVLKVLNSGDSKDPAIIEAQHQLFHHLHKKCLPVQEPVCNIHGQTWAVETVPDDKNPDRRNGPYVFHMLNYIEGDVICKKPYVPITLYNIGVFAGKMHNALQGFENKYFRNKSKGFIWSLTEMTGLLEYTFAVKDKDNLELVTEVIKAFQDEVIPNYKNITEGYIHGDINEQNILVREIAEKQKTEGGENCSCDVTAFIDFADATYSYRVFDVAIMVAYLSIDCKEFDQLDVGGHVLAGYFTELKLNAEEMDVMRICICCRLVQSLVMGAYSYHMTPSNTYVLQTAKRGWPLLWKFWKTPKIDLLNRWDEIINDYKNCK
ncbi:AGPHD1 [Mytilus coruscus]|uniref:Hydroxylysine kinase n=1 Tax=Mytilus coruscus TaxID=42192 RepID=A0A6J8BEX4_MYTCO|nr:AGPHD1 [Mytilus coruscus]